MDVENITIKHGAPEPQFSDSEPELRLVAVLEKLLRPMLSRNFADLERKISLGLSAETWPASSSRPRGVAPSMATPSSGSRRELAPHVGSGHCCGAEQARDSVDASKGGVVEAAIARLEDALKSALTLAEHLQPVADAARVLDALTPLLPHAPASNSSAATVSGGCLPSPEAVSNPNVLDAVWLADPAAEGEVADYADREDGSQDMPAEDDARVGQGAGEDSLPLDVSAEQLLTPYRQSTKPMGPEDSLEMKRFQTSAASRNLIQRRTVMVKEKMSDRLFVLWPPLDDSQSLLARCVHSPRFDMLITLIIFGNSLNTGLQMNDEVHFEINRVHGRGADRSGYTEFTPFVILNLVYTWLYLVEVVLRALVDRSAFVFGTSWRWNALDILLMISAFTEAYANLANFSFARTLRIFRMVRVLHLLRLIRLFDMLRQMVMSVMSSFVSLLWVVVLLFVLLYAFGLYYLQVTVLYLDGYGSTDDWPSDTHLRELELYWGSVWLAMLSLFWSVTGGKDWADLFDPLVRVHVVHGVVYIFFVVFVSFGVLNIVTGIFVDQAMKIAELDRDIVAQRAMQDAQVLTREIKRFFLAADEDGNGLISVEEFRQCLRDDKIRAHFQHLGLDASNARGVFALLDEEGAGEVGIEQFLAGFHRLRGNARSIDLCKVLLAVQDLQPTLEELAVRSGAPVRSRVASQMLRGSRSRFSTKDTVASVTVSEAASRSGGQSKARSPDVSM